MNEKIIEKTIANLVSRVSELTLSNSNLEAQFDVVTENCSELSNEVNQLRSIIQLYEDSTNLRYDYDLGKLTTNKKGEIKDVSN